MSYHITSTEVIRKPPTKCGIWAFWMLDTVMFVGNNLRSNIVVAHSHNHRWRLGYPDCTICGERPPVELIEELRNYIHDMGT